MHTLSDWNGGVFDGGHFEKLVWFLRQAKKL